MEHAIGSAVRLHQAGSLDEAAVVYQRVLQSDPNQVDALHFYGVLLAQLGDFDKAVSLISKAIALRPQYVEAHGNLGRILADRGDLKGALCSYQRAQQLNPDNASVIFAIGILFRSLGNLDEALISFNRALELSPGFAEAHMESGNLLRLLGQVDAAIQSHCKAISLRSNFADAHNSLANALLDKGDLDRAIAEYIVAIQLNRSKAVFHMNLGAALVRAKRFNEAFLAYDFSTQLEPQNIDALTGKAKVFFDLRQFEAAAALLRHVIDLRPDHADAHQAMGDVHLEQKDNTAAERSFRNAVRINPNTYNGWIGLGVALRSMGKFDEAADVFRQVLKIDPQSVIAYKHLAAIGKVGAQEIFALEKQLDEGVLGDEDRVAAGFAIAKLLDDGGQYDEAFRRYAQSNEIVKRLCADKQRSFNRQSLRAEVSRQIQVFNRAYFSSVSAWGNPSDVPTFIVGMPRSGTTLVEQVMASHPQVFGAGELDHISAIREKLLREDGLSDGNWNQSRILTEADTHLQVLKTLAPNGALRIIDKMPGNIFNLGLIATMFPNARVVFCRRDSRDTCLSCYFQWFSGNGLPFSYDLQDCASQYLEQERLEAHWLEHLPLRILICQYEEMISDLEGQSRRLIDFLGLDWDPKCLDFHKTERSVSTSSVWQVRQPIYTRSVGRWKHYERHIGQLLTALGK